ncbi:MAG: type IV toxin-antitoxin system AbiEi family antitoxin domain-containing protein [Anaerolineaceae bacterium]|nr:type IV toxin-antitoxin system AbiEi family antitoxin domain-containing protein [Anaerolineaceae bacterium]
MRKFDKAKQIFTENKGIMRTAEALDAGIAPKTFYAMRDQGIIIQLSRGLYKLADTPPLGNPDLITVALKIPEVVFCLITALDYYNLTEQVPQFVYFAIPQGARRPKIHYPPVNIIWPSKKVYEAGIQEVILDNTPVKIYDPEKTITDCFKYRNKFGLDVAIDAIQRYFEQPPRRQNLNSLMKYAKLNRVEKIITPYIDTLL